jgi:hypothetical protein
MERCIKKSYKKHLEKKWIKINSLHREYLFCVNKIHIINVLLTTIILLPLFAILILAKKNIVHEQKKLSAYQLFFLLSQFYIYRIIEGTINGRQL